MQHLTSRVFALATAVAALTGFNVAAAQNFSFGWNPRSGDVWVDSQLSDVNRYGMRYRQPFIDEMVRYYGAPRDLVTTLLVDRHWAPGDVYYACAIAQILGRPCRHVVDLWERDHGQGWGNVARQLGIKPGSDEFHRLKRGFVPTYDRWARPIRIDEDLYPHYPDRARMAPEGNGGAAPGHANEAPGKAGTPAAGSNRRGGNDKARGGNGKGNQASRNAKGKAKGGSR